MASIQARTIKMASTRSTRLFCIYLSYSHGLYGSTKGRGHSRACPRLLGALSPRSSLRTSRPLCFLKIRQFFACPTVRANDWFPYCVPVWRWSGLKRLRNSFERSQACRQYCFLGMNRLRRRKTRRTGTNGLVLLILSGSLTLHPAWGVSITVALP